MTPKTGRAGQLSAVAHSGAQWRKTGCAAERCLLRREPQWRNAPQAPALWRRACKLRVTPNDRRQPRNRGAGITGQSEKQK